MFNKKGQGTTEYLIILAVIIVIALVVAGVMGWFPSLGGDISDSQSAAYWQSTTPLALTDWSVSTSGVAFTVQNQTQDKIRLTDITVDSTALGLTDANISAGGSTNTTLDADVTCTSGERYSYDVSIGYDVIDGLQGKTFRGTKKLIGVCP